VERSVADWDHHSGIFGPPKSRMEVDRASAAPVKDLKQRGYFDENARALGGEFGRTPVAQATEANGVKLVKGRDHLLDASTVWVAGGGFKPGITFGRPMNWLWVVESPISVHDLQRCSTFGHRS
jgi:hypothetical protein